VPVNVRLLCAGYDNVLKWFKTGVFMLKARGYGPLPYDQVLARKGGPALSPRASAWPYGAM
jgi:hypothetical protein